MPKKKLLKYLKENNWKYTIERDDMLHVIKEMDGSYTLKELYDQAFKRRAVHAKSTIYRNIDLFIEAGLIEKAKDSKSDKKMYQTSKDFYSDPVSA